MCPGRALQAEVLRDEDSRRAVSCRQSGEGLAPSATGALLLSSTDGPSIAFRLPQLVSSATGATYTTNPACLEAGVQAEALRSFLRHLSLQVVLSISLSPLIPPGRPPVSVMGGSPVSRVGYLQVVRHRLRRERLQGLVRQQRRVREVQLEATAPVSAWCWGGARGGRVMGDGW